MGNALFVKRPKTYHDLQKPHSPAAECPYRVVQAISLDALDFENFLYGMDADREYLERYAPLCGDGAVKECLLIQKEHEAGGILAVPDWNCPCYLLWAALADTE